MYVQLSGSGVVVTVEATGAESIHIILRDSSSKRHTRNGQLRILHVYPRNMSSCYTVYGYGHLGLSYTCVHVTVHSHSTVVGSSVSVEFPDLPSGMAIVRANVKLTSGERLSTEWKEIMIPK